VSSGRLQTDRDPQRRRAEHPGRRGQRTDEALIVKTLTNAGYSVQTATTGAQALVKLREADFDAITSTCSSGHERRRSTRPDAS